MSEDNKAPVVANPWSELRRFTPARIALGRSGTSLPTKPHLEFQLAHARARNAVHHELDVEAIRSALAGRGYEVVTVESAADSRSVYLQRPDRGRSLSDASCKRLSSYPRAGDPFDVVFVIGDGLSALAIEENAVGFLDTMMPVLGDAGWRAAPLVVARQARVAIGDEIAELLGARMCVVLIGERPGLSSPDSLGIYMTLNPRKGLTDDSRNCISNVRKAGLSYAAAAHKLLFLMTEARRRNISGVLLKDEAETLSVPGAHGAENFLIASD